MHATQAPSYSLTRFWRRLLYIVFEVPFDSFADQGLRREFGSGHEVREAEAAPATVNGECSLHHATGFSPGKAERVQRPVSQETCLDRNVRRRGVRQGAVDLVRISPGRCRSRCPVISSASG